MEKIDELYNDFCEEHYGEPHIVLAPVLPIHYTTYGDVEFQTVYDCRKEEYRYYADGKLIHTLHMDIENFKLDLELCTPEELDAPGVFFIGGDLDG